MSLDIITSVLQKIDRIPSHWKTFIILVLFGILSINYLKTENRDIIRQYTIFKEMQEQEAETYTLETAADINKCVGDIAKKDTAAYNVILLSYHNTQKSLQGYSYLYLDCLTEKPKGIDAEPLREFWTNLQYTYYEDELSKIHNTEYLRITDIETIRLLMPKFYRKLKLCGAEAAAFYTIEGLKSPIGMIIVLYNHKVYFPIEHFMRNVGPDIQKLAVLLDYKAKK